VNESVKLAPPDVIRPDGKEWIEKSKRLRIEATRAVKDFYRLAVDVRAALKKCRSRTGDKLVERAP
jgi:hypothetical protein